MRWVVILLSTLVILTTGDDHLNSNGPFGKRHTINSEPSPYACHRPNGLLSSSTSLAVASLNVSATTYSSNEQVTVTWTPLPAVCQDDFVGIYFTDIAQADGKYTIAIEIIHTI